MYPMSGRQGGGEGSGAFRPQGPRRDSRLANKCHRTSDSYSTAQSSQMHLESAREVAIVNPILQKRKLSPGHTAWCG